MKNILILDMSDRVGGEIECKLQIAGCTTFRPLSLIEFSQSIGVESLRDQPTFTTNRWVPDVIANFHSQDTKEVLDAVKLAELCGVRVVNCNGARELCSNRMWLLMALREAGVVVPDFFCGHPSRIPSVLGTEVVCKSPQGNLVFSVERTAIKSRDEFVYCERRIPNLRGIVRSVYCVGELIFTMTKKDAFSPAKEVQNEQVTNDSVETAVVSRIRSFLKLDYCNLDFVEETVVDVNSFPNIFRYPDAVKAIAEHIVSL